MAWSRNVKGNSTLSMESESDDDILPTHPKFEDIFANVNKRATPPPATQVTATTGKICSAKEEDDAESLVAELDRVMAPLKRMADRMSMSTSPQPGPSGTAYKMCGASRPKKSKKMENRVVSSDHAIHEWLNFSPFSTVDPELLDVVEEIILPIEWNGKTFKFMFPKGTSFSEVRMEVADRFKVRVDEITLYDEDDLSQIHDTQKVEDIPFGRHVFVLNEELAHNSEDKDPCSESDEIKQSSEDSGAGPEDAGANSVIHLNSGSDSEDSGAESVKTELVSSEPGSPNTNEGEVFEV